MVVGADNPATELLVVVMTGSSASVVARALLPKLPNHAALRSIILRNVAGTRYLVGLPQRPASVSGHMSMYMYTCGMQWHL
jgi:hypothetical protein